MTLITFSVIVTICILNVNYRSPATHRMAPWVKTVFLEFLPKYICLQRPSKDEDDDISPAELHHELLMNHTPYEHHGLLVTTDALGGMDADTDVNLQVCHIHGLNHLEPSTRVANAINYGGVPTQFPNLPSPIFMSESELALRNYLQGEAKVFPNEIQKSATHARFVAQRLRNKDRFGMVSRNRTDC